GGPCPRSRSARSAEAPAPTRSRAPGPARPPAARARDRTPHLPTSLAAATTPRRTEPLQTGRKCPPRRRFYETIPENRLGHSRPLFTVMVDSLAAGGVSRAEAGEGAPPAGAERVAMDKGRGEPPPRRAVTRRPPRRP